MKSQLNLELNFQRDLSSLFLRNQMNMVQNNDFSYYNFLLNKYNKLLPANSKKTYLSLLKFAYSVLKKNYPFEYIIKNEFLTDWVKDELGKSDSIIINEFRVGNSKIDFAMFNGISKGFEIKSELDSPQRLKSQLKDYFKLFNEVYLIVPLSKIEIYETINPNVGIITFDQKNTKSFNLYRNAFQNGSVDAEILISSFRSREYLHIAKTLEPDKTESINSFNQFQVCQQIFTNTENEKLNKLFIEIIKKRKTKSLINKTHYKELNQAVLSNEFNLNSKKILLSNLKRKTDY